jgi:hypothetical protein
MNIVKPLIYEYFELYIQIIGQPMKIIKKEKERLINIKDRMSLCNILS